VTPKQAARLRRQAGYTLIEVIIASALGLLVMSAMTSVVLTSVLAANTATGRVEASTQVRNFQQSAYDDFALSSSPSIPSGCSGTAGSPCTYQALVLQGSRMPNTVNGAAALYSVTYTWDPVQHSVTRAVTGVSTRTTSENVTAYSWYVDGSGAYPSVVVSMTVTIASYNTSYAESQTLRFYPRVTSS
jgi:prepilin-type N-terminal cleavage/methylation domain-containing protein